MAVQMKTRSLIVNKKVLSSTFNLNVMMRILQQLYENGRINRTNLAGKTGLNYNTCIKYINLLQLLGWASLDHDIINYVAISEKGIEFMKSLSGF